MDAGCGHTWSGGWHCAVLNFWQGFTATRTFNAPALFLVRWTSPSEAQTTNSTFTSVRHKRRVLQGTDSTFLTRPHVPVLRPPRQDLGISKTSPADSRAHLRNHNHARNTGAPEALFLERWKSLWSLYTLMLTECCAVPNIVSLPIVRPKAGEKAQPVRTQARSATILPNFVGLRFQIHNGKIYNEVMITEDMVGYKLGEFSPYVPF